MKVCYVTVCSPARVSWRMTRGLQGHVLLQAHGTALPQPQATTVLAGGLFLSSKTSLWHQCTGCGPHPFLSHSCPCFVFQHPHDYMGPGEIIQNPLPISQCTNQQPNSTCGVFQVTHPIQGSQELDCISWGALCCLLPL